MQPGALIFCSLLAANSQISVLIGQKMQLTACGYGNDMHDTKRSDLSGPTVYFLYCARVLCFCIHYVKRRRGH